MSNFVDTAATITYRGYEIRIVGDAVDPVRGFSREGYIIHRRHIIKKGSKILNEQPNIELAKKWIDKYEGGEIEGMVPSDWQSGHVSGREVDLRTGKPVTD